MLPNKKKAGILGKVRSRLSFRPMVYGYANARVRAMRPSLVARRQYEDLLKVHTNAAVAEYLSHTSYRNDFGSMPPKITDEERVELAISRNFARTAQKILRIAPTESKATLKAILSRYDVHNLKAVLLSKKLGKNIEEMRRLLVPAGDTSQKELEQIFNAGNADELYASIRGTEFGAKFLSSASIKRLPRAQIKLLFQNPSDEGKLELFLSSLDIYYYEMAASAVGAGEKDASIILGLLRSEADVKNITTAMRLKRGGADKKTVLEHFVGGGSLSRTALEKMASAKDLAELLPIATSFFISETGKGEFTEAEKLYASDRQLSHFEVVFERSLARRSLKAMYRSVMSIGALVGMIFLKEEEMHNIQKIVRGKALGLPQEKVSGMLILVG